MSQAFNYKMFYFFVIGGNSRSKLVHFGTKPDKKKLADWKDSKDFNPIPIKAEFTPIVNLFSTANLDEKHNISSTAIIFTRNQKLRSWFKNSRCLFLES